MENNLNYKEKCFLGIKYGMIIAAYLFIGIIITYVLFFVSTKSARLLDGIYGIKPIEWLTFISSIIAGILGVTGGIIAARLQISLNNNFKSVKLKKNVLSVLFQEVTFNNLEYVNWYSIRRKEDLMDRPFKITDWDRIKSELYLIDSDPDYKVLINYLYELYGLLERVNQFIDMKIDVEINSKDNLLKRINSCLYKTLNEFKVLKEKNNHE